ncbi:MAG: hypothetical protein ABI091_15405 [Ferruginibacter sp.]
MKKLIGAICFIIIAFFTLYFFIPTNKNFSYKTGAKCTYTAASRQIIYKNRWQAWWPGEKINDSFYSYENYKYRIDKILLDGFRATIFNSNDSLKGFLQFGDYGTDSTQFEWSSYYTYSSNPVKRLQAYFKQKGFQKNIKSLSVSLQKYFDEQKNVYGMKITEEKITQSSLMSMKDTFQHYPSTEEIYNMIKPLEEYVNKVGGKKVGNPMLHIQKTGPANFVAMAAIPTNIVLPSQGRFELKQMVLNSPILVGEVKGGVQTIIDGVNELSNYVIDYHKLSPAISFQSLITNRLSEPDTTKWVTRLYYPVF